MTWATTPNTKVDNNSNNASQKRPYPRVIRRRWESDTTLSSDQNLRALRRREVKRGQTLRPVGVEDGCRDNYSFNYTYYVYDYM